MEPIVTPGLVLKETRYKESDPDHHNFNAGAGGHLRLGTEQPAAEKQIVQRLRAFLLLRICAAAGPEYVHCPGSGK